MSTFSDVLSGFGGLASAGANIFGISKNLDYQKERDRQNVALTREAWQRDDTAVQRRAADLEAAGISPLLAAGSAAQTSGAMNVYQGKKIDPAAMQGVIAGSAMVGKTIADISATIKQMDNQDKLVDSKLLSEELDRNLKHETYEQQYGNKFRYFDVNTGKYVGSPKTAHEWKLYKLARGLDQVSDRNNIARHQAQIAEYRAKIAGRVGSENIERSRVQRKYTQWQMDTWLKRQLMNVLGGLVGNFVNAKMYQKGFGKARARYQSDNRSQQQMIMKMLQLRK